MYNTIFNIIYIIQKNWIYYTIDIGSIYVILFNITYKFIGL